MMTSRQRTRFWFMVAIAVLLFNALVFKWLDLRSAGAQTSPQGSCRSADGSTAWTSILDDCRRQRGQFLHLGGGLSSSICFADEPCRLIPSAMTTTISNYTPKCDEGWSLVMHAGRAMCASELRDPK